jgi:hypothetical protein
MRSRVLRTVKACLHCATPFAVDVVKGRKRHYCNMECLNAARRAKSAAYQLREAICPSCGHAFTFTRKEAGTKTLIYCSATCHRAAMTANIDAVSDSTTPAKIAARAAEVREQWDEEMRMSRVEPWAEAFGWGSYHDVR